MTAVISEDDAVAQTRALNAVDQMLELVRLAKLERDPMRWLQNALLDMREAVSPDREQLPRRTA